MAWSRRKRKRMAELSRATLENAIAKEWREKNQAKKDVREKCANHIMEDMRIRKEEFKAEHRPIIIAPKI